MDLTFTLDEFKQFINRCAIAHSVEKINDKILHIKIYHNGAIFRLRFVYSNGVYQFDCFFEG